MSSCSCAYQSDPNAQFCRKCGKHVVVKQTEVDPSDKMLAGLPASFMSVPKGLGEGTRAKVVLTYCAGCGFNCGATAKFCKKCGMTTGVPPATPTSPDKEREHKTAQLAPSFGSYSTQPTGLGGGKPCSVCSKTVYKQEGVMTGDKADKDGNTQAYHLECFRCAHCHSSLSVNSFASEGGKVFCIPHYKTLFGQKGIYDELTNDETHTTKRATSPTPLSPTASALAGKIGGGKRCTLCDKTVYDAEGVKTGDGIYHVGCFLCSVCNMKLDIKKFSSDHGKLYCHFHYEEAVKRLGIGKGGIGGEKIAASSDEPIIPAGMEGVDLSAAFRDAAVKRAEKQAAQRPAPAP